MIIAYFFLFSIKILKNRINYSKYLKLTISKKITFTGDIEELEKELKDLEQQTQQIAKDENNKENKQTIARQTVKQTVARPTPKPATKTNTIQNQTKNHRQNILSTPTFKQKTNTKEKLIWQMFSL